MTKTKPSLKIKITVVTISVVVLLAGAAAYSYYRATRTPKSTREQACERAASAAKAHSGDAALEGISLDEATCNGLPL